MEQHKILKVYASTKSKDGKEYKTKDGKPFTRVAIQTSQLLEGVWASANVFREDDPILQLKQGDMVNLKVWQEGQWWNFKIPSRTDELEDRILALEERVFGNDEAGEIKIEKGGEITAEDLPF